MRRCLAVMLTTLAVMSAGCARVSPIAQPETTAPPATIEIGTDGTPTVDLIARLYVAALEADGQSAHLVEVVPGTETLAVADQSPVAMPVFAGTLLQQFSKEPSAADPATVVTELATAVEPALGVLKTTSVDGGLVWAVTMQAASGGVGDLAAVGEWGADKVVAAPGFSLTSSAGVPALQVAYGSKATIEQVDESAARHDALVDGSADAAGFRRTDADLSDLIELDDPVGVTAPDPLVVLLAADFAEQRPGAVLVLDAVQQALTTESVAELSNAAAEQGTGPAITEWLKSNGFSD